MLRFITSTDDPVIEYIKDDPVRPELSADFRVGKNKFISTLVNDSPEAIVCVSLNETVPDSVSDLAVDTDKPTTAVFYTIWSYRSGAATELLFQTVDKIKEQFPEIKRFVTLSPKTEMARKFHLKNGADIFRENESTINYEYHIKS